MSRLAALAPQEATADVSGADRCGPDITDWLVKLFNGVINHQAIQDAKDNWSKGTSQGRIAAAITFGMAFQTGGPLDIKQKLKDIKTDHCPSGSCDSTVTICDKCYHADVTGNMLYGAVGKTIGMPEDFLHLCAAIAQAIDSNNFSKIEDTPADSHAIDLGFCIFNKANGADASITKDMICECISDAEGLNARTECAPCDEVYTAGDDQ